VAVARPLRAAPRPDSAGLTSAERALAAAHGFRLRPGRLASLRRASAAGPVVVLDDIVTTGATLAAVAATLARSGVPVSAAAVLAATRRRWPAAGTPVEGPVPAPRPPGRGEGHAKVYRTRGDGMEFSG
jgi:hypothetical protein